MREKQKQKEERGEGERPSKLMRVDLISVCRNLKNYIRIKSRYWLDTFSPFLSMLMFTPNSCVYL